MRIAVTGRSGQVVSAMSERASHGIELVTLGRPKFDLADAGTVGPAIAAAAPDLIVSAAAYTAVDKAESEPDLARAVNGVAPGLIGEAAAALGIPVIHLSTDYVFAGDKPAPYVETDMTGPATTYGRTKLEGEERLAAATDNHLILRTAWVYSPFGGNFVKTMLRLAATRDEVRVVADQRGCPTSALDIADAIFSLAPRLSDGEAPRGVFHLVGSGETDWASFAAAIFEESSALGGPSARVVPITTAEYPTPAHRPANSRLSTGKLHTSYGLALPQWRASLRETVGRLLSGR